MDQKPKIKVHLVDFKRKVFIGTIVDPKNRTEFWTSRIKAICEYKYPKKRP